MSDKQTAEPIWMIIQSKIYDFLNYHKIEEPVFDVREVGDLAKDIIKTVQQEYKNQLPQAYCRWVKASDRLPEKPNLVHIRYWNDWNIDTEFRTTGWRDQTEWYNQTGRAMGNPKSLEWLEESQLPLDARQIIEAYNAGYGNGSMRSKIDGKQYLSTLNTKE